LKEREGGAGSWQLLPCPCQCPEKHPFQGAKSGSKEDTGSDELIVGSFDDYGKMCGSASTL